MSIKFSTLTFFSSIVYALLHGVGFYGYGIDYYRAYHRVNYSYGGLIDALGWKVSTFGIGDFHLGVYIVTFLLAFSLSFFMRSLYFFLNIRLGFIAFVSFLLLIHSWPIFMSTSNVMRQGLMMSLLYFSLSYHIKSEYGKGGALFLPLIFSHKSGLFFFAMAFIGYLVRLSRRLSFLRSLGEPSMFILLGFLLSVVLIPFAGFLFEDDDPSRVVGADKRYVLLCLNLVYIFIYLLVFDNRSKSSYVANFLFLFSLSAPSLLLAGKNFEYDRLNMVMMNAYLLFYATCFPKALRSYYVMFISSAFVVLTYYMGMFASFK